MTERAEQARERLEIEYRDRLDRYVCAALTGILCAADFYTPRNPSDELASSRGLGALCYALSAMEAADKVLGERFR